MVEPSLRFRGTRATDVVFLEENAKKEGVVQLPSGLQYKVLKEEKDKAKPSPQPWTKCKCHYKGRLVDGTEFDSSYKRGKPLTFAPNQVVPAWTEAMQLMRAGDKWEIYAPASLGYGEKGAGPIPGGASLIFELELLEVVTPLPDRLRAIFPEWLWGFIIFGICIAVLVVVGLLKQGDPAITYGPVVSVAEASNAENPHVFFDIEIGAKSVGRIEFELFSTVVPKTAENFRALATGDGTGNSGKPLHFKGSKFHRIIPGFMCQGGDITRGNGMGGESIYGSSFDDEWEKGYVKHSEPFLLSMANRGKNTQSSQFFITVASTSHLNGKHVVFGRVTKGHDVVKMMEKVGSQGGTPSERVRVTDCGQLPQGGGGSKAEA